MYIPWRIILELEIPAEKAIDKLAYATRPRKNIWYFLGFSSADMWSKFDGILFDGTIDKHHRKFHLSSSSGRGDVVLQGTIENRVMGSVVRVWVLPPAYMILVALSFAAYVLVMSIAHPKPQEDPFLILKLAAFMIGLFGLIFWGIRLKVQSVLKNVFAGKIAKPLAEQRPWPELPQLFAHPPTRPDDEPDMIPTPEPSLVDQFEMLSREILTHKATPPHTIRVDTNKEHLSVKFPPRSAEGFDVSIEVDNKGATVFAGCKEVFVYPMGEYGGDTFNLIADVCGVLRTMLSPEFQIRVFSVNGVVVKSQAEVVDKKGKVTPVLDWKVKGKIPAGIKTERVLINRHMPRPN